MIQQIKTYGKKPLLQRLLTKKKGYIRLYATYKNDWKTEY